MSDDIQDNDPDQYRQVAALVCQDIEIYYMTAERFPHKALEYFKLLKEKKDKLISDRKHREMRYNAGCLIFSAVKANNIVSESL